MVTTTRIPAPTVSGRLSPRSVLAQLLSRPTTRSITATRGDRERHLRVRGERIERERRSVQAQLAMLYVGVRR